MATTKQLGDRAEELVSDWLRSRGIQIVARNLRLGMLELDIVARLEEVIIVVEVRTRGSASWTTGLSSIDAAKRARLRRAAKRLWDRRYRHDASVSRLRLDVAVVSFDGSKPTIEYVEAAF